MKVLLSLLIVALVSLVSQDTDVQFSATANSIRCGQTVTLRWKTHSASRVFILGVGKVEATGEIIVSPSRTTTYTLLAETPSGYRTKSTKIKVVCGDVRGDDDYPDDEKFESQLSSSLNVSSFVGFIEHTQRVLQDEMGFTLKSYQSIDGQSVFIKTRVSERKASSREAEENKIDALRISFLVEIRKSERPREVTYTIKTFIQHKKLLKDSWSMERDNSVHRAEADRLRQALEQYR